MQLNVGIIAATIPTLRPLLRKSGLATSENRYNQFDANDSLAKGTIGSGLTPRPRNIDSLWTHTGPGQVNFEMVNAPYRTTNGAAKINIYSAPSERSGSEADIVSHIVADAKGIRCTTKVVVGESAEKDLHHT